MPDLVVFLAGAGESASVWDAQRDLLGPVRSMAFGALDLATPFVFDEAVASLHRHVRETAARSVTVVGLSIGAMIAARYASLHPVASLVLSGGQVRPPRVTMAVQRLVLGAVPERHLGLPDGMSKKDLLHILGVRVDLTPDLSRITAPTVVLCGSKDRPNLPAAHRFAGAIGGSHLQIVDGGGHQLATDSPAAFAEAVRQAIGQAGPR